MQRNIGIQWAIQGSCQSLFMETFYMYGGRVVRFQRQKCCETVRQEQIFGFCGWKNKRIFNNCENDLNILQEKVLFSTLL